MPELAIAFDAEGVNVEHTVSWDPGATDPPDYLPSRFRHSVYALHIGVIRELKRGFDAIIYVSKKIQQQVALRVARPAFQCKKNLVSAHPLAEALRQQSDYVENIAIALNQI